MNIDDVLTSSVDSTTKGMPAGIGTLSLASVGKQGWNVLREDLPLPLLVLKKSALDRNSRWMRAFLKATGVSIAPHGKTTMSPQLFARQLEDGAWGMTCATVEQLQVYRAFGVKRVIFANQLIGRQPISFVLGEIARDPDFEFYALVDSTQGVQLLAEAASQHNTARPLRLLLEVGRRGGRTGVRTLEEAEIVARAVAKAAPRLALCGVESYEGTVPGMTDQEMEPGVAAIFDFQEQVVRLCSKFGLFDNNQSVVLSAGGSQFPDVAALRLRAIEVPSAVVIIRSGCYLTHDNVRYAASFARISKRNSTVAANEGGLVAACEVWAYIQSRPEAGIAFATMGKRDTGSDWGLPLPLYWYRPHWHSKPDSLPAGHKTFKLNDQHTWLEIPDNSPLKVGDMIGFGISHPCTTFDKWQVVPVINDDYDVIEAIRTYF